MRRKTSTPTAESLVLGISVSSRTIHGVLVEQTPDGPRLLRHLVRTRGEVPTPVGAMAGAFALADGDDAPGSTLQIGEAAVGVEMFLGNEFSGLTGQTGALPAGMRRDATIGAHELITREVLDMAAEVRDALGQEPALAFVSAAEDVTYAQVHIADLEKEKADRRRTRLLAALAEQVHDLDADRAVFLPVVSTAADEQVHALGVVPHLNDPVTQSLAAAVSQRRTLRPCLLDAELPLLIGLARLAPFAPSPYDAFYGAGSTSGDGAGDAAELPVLVGTDDAAVASVPTPADMTGTMLVLRAGIEDTLALFLKDGQVQYFERMRTVTAFDAPETLCSRILLLQDEHGVGELARVLLLGEQGEADLIDAFALFFPEANVGSLRTALPGGLAAEALAVAETGPALALAVALRLASKGATVAAFPQVNFLPTTLTRRRFVVPYTWHVYLLLGLLFATVLFFMARYFTYDAQIEQQRAAVQAVDPVSAESSVQQLQGRLDSLQSAQAQYAQALGVLDSLLLGSDRWSRALDLVSRESQAVRGVWIDNWEQNGNEITLNGNALRREQVVAFAERTGGSLQSLVAEEVREAQVYAFTLSIPLATDLPEAVRYLREQAAQQAGLSSASSAMTAPAGAAPTEGAPAVQ